MTSLGDAETVDVTFASSIRIRQVVVQKRDLIASTGDLMMSSALTYEVGPALAIPLA